MFEECKLIFLTDIKKMITEDKIPPEFVLNVDQTPCSNFSIGRMMMAARNASSVSNKGVTDKRSITLTFVIRRILTHSYTKRKQPRGFKIPRGFAIFQNPKQYSIEDKTLTLIDEVIVPYIERKRKELKLAPTQKALLICDVFRGQKAAKVSKKLASLNIAIVSLPANMIHFFQPLDLTINGEAKRYMKDKFSTWYSDEVKQQIESGMRQH